MYALREMTESLYTEDTREVAARCMLLYAEPYRREPPFPHRAGVVIREEPQATAERA